jgi:hypothetical protein
MSKNKDRYMFLGVPDEKLPNLVTGEVYDLQIIDESVGVLGFLFGKRRPIIVQPFVYFYPDWETFHRNWHLISLNSK